MTRSVASASKKKRKREADKEEEAPAAKKAKVEHLTVGVVIRNLGSNNAWGL